MGDRNCLKIQVVKDTEPYDILQNFMIRWNGVKISKIKSMVFQRVSELKFVKRDLEFFYKGLFSLKHLILHLNFWKKIHFKFSYDITRHFFWSSILLISLDAVGDSISVLKNDDLILMQKLQVNTLVVKIKPVIIRASLWVEDS